MTPAAGPRPSARAHRAAQPIIRWWFQRSTGPGDVRRQRRAARPTATSCAKSRRVPPCDRSERRTAPSRRGRRETRDLEHAARPADRVQHQVERVRQRRAAQHPRVVRAERGDRNDLRPPVRVVLEVDSTRVHGGRGRRRPPRSRRRCRWPAPSYRAPMTDADVTPARAARAWAAEDPDPQTRAELEAVVAEVEKGGDPTDLRGPVRRHAGVRHGRPARRARRRTEPDEPGRGHPRRGRAWRRTCSEHGRHPRRRS